MQTCRHNPGQKLGLAWDDEYDDDDDRHHDDDDDDDDDDEDGNDDNDDNVDEYIESDDILPTAGWAASRCPQGHYTK